VKATAFFHIATIGAYQAVVDELMDCVMGSRLIDRLDGLYCGVCGPHDVRLPTHPKIKAERLRNDADKFEFPTMQVMHAHAKANPGEAVLYFHTKGVTHMDCPPIQDWRRYMAYFNIELWQEPIARLEMADTAGVDFVVFHIDTTRCTSNSITYYGRDLHYSGNFWWAKTDYLNTLPELDDVNKGRHECEMWIGKGKGTHWCMWNSRIPILARQYFSYGRAAYAPA